MNKIRSLVVFAVILTLIAGAFYVEFTRAGSTPESMGMEGEEFESPSRLSGAPNTTISGPFVSISAPPASFDGSVADIPQVGPSEKKPMREMPLPYTGESATDGSGPDPVLQESNFIDAMPGVGVSFKGLDLLTWGAG